MKHDFERLPKTVVPINYHLHFIPNIPKFSFTGSASISIKVSRSSNFELYFISYTAKHCNTIPYLIKYN